MAQNVEVKYSNDNNIDKYTLKGHATDDKVIVTTNATINGGVINFDKNGDTKITVTDSTGAEKYAPKKLSDIQAQTSSYGGNLSRKRRRRRRRSASKRRL